MKKIKLKLTREQLKTLTRPELVKLVTAGYECPVGYYWDTVKKECILDS